ncbi:DNA mismatch repair protein MutS [Roseivirga sp. 4D4]|uniref:MutS-related protein n=1 Tax=Roseivirga sp. 4D4 TaxID=1889784 RepID=UPI00085290F1|nr:DNA mismatch repair protein MutS [Roseivirga sp. 4D4]OEK00686.1 DNA mismatch repair protein MutS [Roseivirga sp. 4D4]
MKIYQDHIEQYKQEAEALEEQTRRYSLLRLVAFIFSFILIIILANERLLEVVWVVGPICIFVFVSLLKHYNELMRQKQRANFLKQINENELLRLKNELSGFDKGLSQLDEEHAYMADLDIFGSHSLFQLLNRTTTESGSLRLAQWLSRPATKPIILERQQAIQELNPNIVWRQEFEAAGLPFANTNSEYQKLLNWVAGDNQLLSKKNVYLAGSVVLGVLALTLGLLSFFNSTSPDLKFYLPPFLIVMFLNYRILKKVAPLSEDIIDSTHQNVQTLGGYQMLARTILSEEFQSKRLQGLQKDLQQKDSSAIDEMGSLKKILSFFQLRGTKRSDNNKFYGLLNQFLLFDIYCILKAEQWKSRNRAHIQSWVEAISEFEALNSLAGFAYSNPDFAFPEIKEAPYHIQFETLGHPLINAENRVCNDFNLSGQGQITMITGSNMAGKSTFLRTVGTNLVLALMGAPCCAKSGQVSHMKMFTSMRTKDNLEEGVSSFYAELQRVEQLLALITSGEPIFFMLDEMFKGTNSEDRYKGGVSLIKQLNELNAFGIVSTHDLELANLSGKHMIVSNLSFNSKIADGELSFNYKLTEGICTDFNASELMKRSGIKVLKDIESLSLD